MLTNLNFEPIASLSFCPSYSCRVYSYSFWIGLLIPFCIIYIMNWVIFIHIFGSLVFRPNVRKDTSTNANLRKLKQNFMIALGLSLLFGMGWAIGLLASSDLPAAVRYPAEWIFTLATAFLGVYLFAMYVLRSQEARKFWKRWFLCQSKKKPSVSSTSTPSRTRWGSVASTVRAWGRRLTPSRLTRASAVSSILTHNPPSASNQPCPTSGVAGRMDVVNSSGAEPSSVFESATVKVTGPDQLKMEAEMVQKVDPDRESIKEDAELVSSSLSGIEEESATL